MKIYRSTKKKLISNKSIVKINIVFFEPFSLYGPKYNCEQCTFTKLRVYVYIASIYRTL